MSNTDDTAKSREARTDRSSRDPHRNSGTGDRPSPVEVLREARVQLAELTGMAAESVSSFEQTDGGWSLEVEILELARIPDTMSLMASYRVDLDEEGRLTGYRRVRRYERGRADPRGPGGR